MNVKQATRPVGVGLNSATAEGDVKKTTRPVDPDPARTVAVGDSTVTKTAIVGAAVALALLMSGPTTYDARQASRIMAAMADCDSEGMCPGNHNQALLSP
jgi:hypothetical protein